MASASVKAFMSAMTSRTIMLHILGEFDHVWSYN